MSNNSTTPQAVPQAAANPIVAQKAANAPVAPTPSVLPKKVAKAAKKNKAAAKAAQPKKKLGQKQIPTILGMIVLLVSLAAGVLLFGDGTGVFAPRATPETTPKNIRVSNLSDKSFSISFFTDEETVAYVKYGESPDDLKKQASDDRDQLSGVVKPYRLHHITVRGIDANKKYYYVLGTGSKSTFDNNGEPYSIQTAIKPSSSSPNVQTLYGTVSNDAGGAAEGSIVFLYIDGAGTLSSLVKSSGSWAISLANAFNAEGTGFPDLTDDSTINLKIQGIDPALTSQLSSTIAEAQPVPDLVLGALASADETMEEFSETADAVRDELLAEDVSVASQTATVEDLVTEIASAASEVSEVANSATASAGALGGLVEETVSEVERTLDLDNMSETQTAAETVIETTQPKLKATLPANTTVKIEIHSDTQISQTVQTDSEGNLELDVSSLGENLEPGEHTATYSYIDPTTGEEVTKTYTFTVADDAVAADTTSQIADSSLAETVPYGSGNPYSSSTTPTPSPTITATPSATPTVSTRSTVVSTESGSYNSGSTATTLTLLIAAFFFVFTGVWSFLLAGEFKRED